MPDDLDLLFASARARVDAVALPDPAHARRVGTRRRRLRLAGTAVATAAAVAALAGTLVTLPHAAGPQPPTGRSASTAPATPSTTPSASAPAPSASASAVPGPNDLGPGPGAPGQPDPACATVPAACYPPVADWHEERLPAPCAVPSHPSDALLVARRARGGSIPDADSAGNLRHTTYYETLTRYRGDGAERYLAEVRAAVRRCPSIQRPTGRPLDPSETIRYALRGSGFAGDDSILISRSYRHSREGEPDSTVTYLIAVVRVGTTVVVGYDHGWEGTPTARARFDELVQQALAAVRAGAP